MVKVPNLGNLKIVCNKMHMLLTKYENKVINFMKVNIKDPEEDMSDFVSKVLKSGKIENLVAEVPQEKPKQIEEENSIDVFKIRQLEQKQELLVGLTNVLFKKFEELHPTTKHSKFEFTDISWYKKLAPSQ